MRRSARTLAALTPLILIASAASPASADDKQDFSKVQIKATKVAGQVYVIEDATAEFSVGNVGVSVGPDGIVLIDDKFAPLAPKLEAALRTVSDQPVRFVINTHYHGDHTDGNAVFGLKSTVIAHENTRKRMAASKDQPPIPPPRYHGAPP